jgi:hypothetical protein
MARPKSAVKHTMAPTKKLDFAKTIQYEALKVMLLLTRTIFTLIIALDEIISIDPIQR